MCPRSERQERQRSYESSRGTLGASGPHRPPYSRSVGQTLNLVCQPALANRVRTTQYRRVDSLGASIFVRFPLFLTVQPLPLSSSWRWTSCVSQGRFLASPRRRV